MIRDFFVILYKNQFQAYAQNSSLPEIWFCILTITTLSSLTAKRFIVNLYKKLFAFFIKVVNFNKC